VLLANIASLYAVFHGPEGLKRIASRIHRLTDILADGCRKRAQAAPRALLRHPVRGSGRQSGGAGTRKRWKLTCAATSITPLASLLMKRQPAKMC
jgi:hypothetical protein